MRNREILQRILITTSAPELAVTTLRHAAVAAAHPSGPPMVAASLTVYAKEGKANLGMFDVATGKETDITSANQAVVSFRAVPDASKFVYLISTPTRIGDLFWVEQQGRDAKPLTHLNDELFSKLKPYRAGRDLVQEL